MTEKRSGIAVSRVARNNTNNGNKKGSRDPERIAVIAADSAPARDGNKTPGARAGITRATSLPEWVRAHAAEVELWPAIEDDRGGRCVVGDCERPTFAIQLCRGHYQRAKRAFRAESREGKN
jgi:hypothetical protein